MTYFYCIFCISYLSAQTENTENADTPIDTTPKKNTDMKSMIAALKQNAALKQGNLIPIN